MIKRIIARLDIKNNFLVKGMNLEGLRILGYPELFSKKYFDEGIDEIIFQDVVASLYKRNQLSHLTSKISENVFVPITVVITKPITGKANPINIKSLFTKNLILEYKEQLTINNKPKNPENIIFMEKFI